MNSEMAYLELGNRKRWQWRQSLDLLHVRHAFLVHFNVNESYKGFKGVLSDD